MDNEEKMKEKIVSLLKKKREGLTITEVSSSLDIHYITSTKYLAVLQAEGKLVHRRIGMAKLFRIKSRNGKKRE